VRRQTKVAAAVAAEAVRNPYGLRQIPGGTERILLPIRGCSRGHTGKQAQILPAWRASTIR
jgi:hypothetical protein